MKKQRKSTYTPKLVVIPYQVRSYQTHDLLEETGKGRCSRNPLSSQVISNSSDFSDKSDSARRNPLSSQVISNNLSSVLKRWQSHRRNPLSSQVISNACEPKDKGSGKSRVVIPYQVRSYQTNRRPAASAVRAACRNPLSSQVISNQPY